MSVSKAASIAFSGGRLDIAEKQRSAEELTKFSKMDTACAIIMHDGGFVTVPDGRLAKVPPMDLVGKHIIDPGPLFLGLDHVGPVFAFSMAQVSEANALFPGGQVRSLRALAETLNAEDLATAGRAKSLFDWHKDHRFCAKCGKDSASQHGGIARFCKSCETAHFPRVNPVAIMLVLNGDKCLLGRNAAWPDGAFSALAGFVSPGESLEEACAREVFEEVGLKVTNIRYQFSQPWPWPSQLMMGLFCETDEMDITLDLTEVSEAVWYTREQIQGVFDGTDDSFACPPAFTIAHQLIKAWLES